MSHALAPGQDAPGFSVVLATGQPLSLAALRGRVVVVRFFRHLGCPVCRMELAEMTARAGELLERGAEVIVFLESPAGSVRAWAEERRARFRVVGDPERTVYAAWGVEIGSLRAFVAPGAAARAAQATLRGHLHGRFEGHERQLPADFVIDAGGRVAWAHYGKHIADNASFDAIRAQVDAATARAAP